MAISEPLAEVECAWCGKVILVQVPTNEIIHCHYCSRPLEIWGDGDIGSNSYYSTMVRQNTKKEKVRNGN